MAATTSKMGRGGEEMVIKGDDEAALKAGFERSLKDKDLDELVELERALVWTLHQVRSARKSHRQSKQTDTETPAETTTSSNESQQADPLLSQLTTLVDLVPKALCSKDFLRKLRSRSRASRAAKPGPAQTEEGKTSGGQKKKGGESGEESGVTEEWSDKEIEAKAAGPPWNRRDPHEETKQLVRHVFHQNRITHVALVYLVVSTTVPLAFLRNLRCMTNTFMGPFDKLHSRFKSKFFKRNGDLANPFDPEEDKRPQGVVAQAKEAMTEIAESVSS